MSSTDVPVLVIADKGFIFVGEVDGDDLMKRVRSGQWGTLTLRKSRNVIFHPRQGGGMLGLCERGPVPGTKLGTARTLPLYTQPVAAVSRITEDAWKAIQAHPEVG